MANRRHHTARFGEGNQSRKQDHKGGQCHKLILWSVREGKLLEEAVEWCRKRGVEFYAVNKDFPEEDLSKNQSFSRKIKADIWIDDRNIGGLPDWGTIYQMITEKKTYEQVLMERMSFEEPKPKKKWWQF